jgi:hypothetical protein
MMPVEFPEQNVVFTKPKEMTDEQCGQLPVHIGKDEEGNRVMISCWKFSKEDLETIAKTGTIYLNITAQNMPPVSLFTENPFVHE